MKRVCIAALAAMVSMASSDAAFAWKPERNVQIVVPAGPGGASDQLARLVQSIITKYKLVDRAVSVVNKPGANSAEGLLDVSTSSGDPHKLLVALSNLYVLPLSSDLKFHWSDLEPVAIMAFDDFILWAHADQPENTTRELLASARNAQQPWRMGGTQAKNDDQILTFAIEKATGVKFVYIPYRGGAEVATQLVGKHVTTNVNNPGENVSQWKAGLVKPYCVFSGERISFKQPVAAGKSWNDIPTCKEQGLDIEFKVLRVFMMPRGVTAEQRDFYVSVFDKIRNTDEWKAFSQENAYQDAFITGAAASAFMKRDEENYEKMMREAGFLHPSRK